VQQASDCQSRDELGQFIREWLVGADAERLLREQLAVPDENKGTDRKQPPCQLFVSTIREGDLRATLTFRAP
jgi:hypothetical protein